MNDYLIPSLSNACQIMRVIVDSDHGLSRDDIAEILAIPRSSAYRILQTLLKEGMVEHRQRRYFPGSGLYTLGLKLSSVNRLRPLARPVLQHLVQKTGFTAHLAVPSGYKSLLVEVVDCQNLLRVASRAGSVSPLHVAAAGKIFLAYLFSDDVETVESELGFEKYTARTNTTLESVKKEIQATLKRGYGIDEREFDDSVRCLAAPVFDASGTVMAAIGITSPAVQFPKRDIPEVATIVKEHARRCYELLKGE